MYIILKHVKTERGIRLPVVMLDSQSEVLEFETLEEAEKMQEILQANSDSKHIYKVKKIGD